MHRFLSTVKRVDGWPIDFESYYGPNPHKSGDRPYFSWIDPVSILKNRVDTISLDIFLPRGSRIVSDYLAIANLEHRLVERLKDLAFQPRTIERAWDEDGDWLVITMDMEFCFKERQ